MQKSPLFALIREEVTRALVFGIAFVVIVSVGFTGVAYAANGGKFGEILNLILTGNIAGVAGKTWETPGDGTVANATKLGGKLSTEFILVKAGQSCAANKCVT